MTKTAPRVVLFAIVVTLVFVALRRYRMTSDGKNHSRETILTSGPGGRILTQARCWSADCQWIVFDTRSDEEGARFDGTCIQAVHAQTKEVRTLYEARNGACCGVASWHPQRNLVAFILGPEYPTPDYRYSAARRQGMIVDCADPRHIWNLDARNLVAPFTPGALRGGSHVHMWHPLGDWLSFTSDDDVLSAHSDNLAEAHVNQRNVAVAIPQSVQVPKSHPRNHDGTYFSVVVTRTVNKPRSDSDEIGKACEESWVGLNGYLKPDGSRQQRALAFQGTVQVAGQTSSEVFIVDLPANLTQAGTEPLEGTETRRPAPPQGVLQRRLTFTTHHKYPGLQGPRHWLHSSPDGSQIGFLRRDPAGIVQLFTVSPNGGDPRQITYNTVSIASSFTWRPDGRAVAFVMEHSVCSVNVASGVTTRHTPRCEEASAPRPEACVYSPDGRHIAFVRRIPHDGRDYNQICSVHVPDHHE